MHDDPGDQSRKGDITSQGTALGISARVCVAPFKIKLEVESFSGRKVKTR
jgi:hypothetical protein